MNSRPNFRTRIEHRFNYYQYVLNQRLKGIREIGTACGEVCGIFCCPPFPSSIACKLAFAPSTTSSYEMTPQPKSTRARDASNPNGIQKEEDMGKESDSFKNYARKKKDKYEEVYSLQFVNSYGPQLPELQKSFNEKDKVEMFYTKSSMGNRIACMYIKSSAGNLFTILYSHANACDLGEMTETYLKLGSKLKCNIFSYDYSGYGCSSGQPSEKNLQADIKAAYKCLRERYDVSPEEIVLYGQSIGNVPTAYLASKKKYPVGGIILQSGFTSGLRALFSDITFKRTWFFDVFPIIENIKKVRVPLLVIHGTADEVLDFSSHGMALYNGCPKAVEPLWVKGGHHNDINGDDKYEDEYMNRLKRFCSMELLIIKLNKQLLRVNDDYEIEKPNLSVQQTHPTNSATTSPSLFSQLSGL